MRRVTVRVENRPGFSNINELLGVVKFDIRIERKPLKRSNRVKKKSNKRRSKKKITKRSKKLNMRKVIDSDINYLEEFDKFCLKRGLNYNKKLQNNIFDFKTDDTRLIDDLTMFISPLKMKDKSIEELLNKQNLLREKQLLSPKSTSMNSLFNDDSPYVSINWGLP